MFHEKARCISGFFHIIAFCNVTLIYFGCTIYSDGLLDILTIYCAAELKI